MNTHRARVWTDHACRACGARICAYDDEHSTVYECGTCGKIARDNPEEICGCGVYLNAWLRLPKGKRDKEPRPKLSPGGPRFYCGMNAAQSDRDPAVVVIFYAVRPTTPAPARVDPGSPVVAHPASEAARLA